MNDGHHNDRCLFCGVGPEKAPLFRVSGDNEFLVCKECAETMQDLDPVTDERPARALPAPLAPRDLRAYLDRYVVGQDGAKKALAVALASHMRRIAHPELKLRKANLLLVGPSGTGKTYLVKKAAQAANLPVAFGDATSLTQAGYVGDDVESVLVRLIRAADGDIELAQRGIVFLDEVDKIARKEGQNVSITRDVSGEGVQQALLKLIEGTVAKVPLQEGRKHPQQETVSFDTSNVLWIFAGAFEGLEEILRQRARAAHGPSVGFGAASTWELSLPKPTHEDLIEYGMIPEFMGRVPNLVVLEPLDREALERIIDGVEDSHMEHYRNLFKTFGVELEVTGEFVREVARRALERHAVAGGRAPLAVLEPLMQELLYHLPDPQIGQLRLDARHLDDPEAALAEARQDHEEAA